LKFFDYLEKIIEILTICIFCLMLFALFVQVVSRYIFTPIAWTEELARYTYIWLVYLGVAVLQKHKEHIKLDLLNKFLPKKLLKCFDLIIDLLIIYIVYFIVLGGYKYSMIMGRAISTVIPIQLKYIYIIIPIGFGLMLVFTIGNIYNTHIINLFSKDKKNK